MRGPRVERNFDGRGRIDGDRRGPRGGRDVIIGDRDGRGYGRHHRNFRRGGIYFGSGYGYYDPYYYDTYYDDDVGSYAYDTADADEVERCRDRYRSFDAATGTFLGYDGLRHVCPYLR